MTRKIFLICLMILLGVQSAALAKEKGLPEAERIPVAVEVINSSRYKNLSPDQLLEEFLLAKLVEKNLLNVVETKTADAQVPEDGLIRDEEITAEHPAANIGEILIFNAVEIPRDNDTIAKDFDAELYRERGAAYVIRCEVLGLGATKVDDKTIGMITGIVGGGLSLGGAGNKNRDKALRRVGAGIGLLGLGEMLDVTKRTALNTVVNMQFINAETGEIVWQENFIGQALKHHSPRKGFSDVWEEAYIESVEDSAKRISKRVNKYIDRVVIKGKSDKSFMPKKFSLGGLKGGKLF